MTKLIKIGDLSIDPVALGSQGNAVLGIRGSGKTYTATLLAEKLHDAGIPFIAFDPIGIWRFLRVPGAGKGYPVVVAGGQDGDLPLTVASAPEIVRAAMASGVSLVIDLFDINLSKADWKRIVMACVRVLLHENSAHGLRHVFIEEAAEFAPQKVGPDQGQVYAEIEKLARMGGNSRLGYTLVNQRAEEVNKAVLELCDNLFLHRQKGRNSLTALSKWLDIGNADNAKQIIASMTTLPTGQCWAWMGESAAPVLITIPPKNSFHPDRTIMRGDVAIKSKKAVDVGSFVETMKAGLAKFVEDAKANDPVALRKQVTDLQKQIATHRPAEPDPQLIVDAEQRGKIAGYALGVDETKRKVLGFAGTLVVEESALSATRESPAAKPAPKRPLTPVTSSSETRPLNIALPLAGSASSFTGPQMKIMQALAMWAAIGHTRPSRAMLATAAGYSPSGGTFKTYLSQLKTAGSIDYPQPDAVCLLTGYPAASLEASKAQFWATLTGPQQKLVEVLQHGDLSRAQLAEQAGYEPNGGTFKTYLSQLRTLSLIDYPTSGMVALEAWVFEIL